MYNVGQSIKRAQEIRQITNAAMADDFGVVRQQVHRWQTTTDMRLSKIESFANYFDMTVYDFISLGKEH